MYLCIYLLDINVYVDAQKGSWKERYKMLIFYILVFYTLVSQVVLFNPFDLCFGGSYFHAGPFSIVQSVFQGFHIHLFAEGFLGSVSGLYFSPSSQAVYLTLTSYIPRYAMGTATAVYLKTRAAAGFSGNASGVLVPFLSFYDPLPSSCLH